MDWSFHHNYLGVLMKKNSMATWRTWYNQKTRSARKRQQLWTHGKHYSSNFLTVICCVHIYHVLWLTPLNTTLDETPQIEAKFQLTLPLNKINTSKTNSYIQLFPQIHVAGVNLDRWSNLTCWNKSIKWYIIQSK